ncbi:hypothetical protein H7F36_04780 [Variovorax sp. PAMC28562]|uniref:hypothetical protein n=1 Tax=Variovorax sp. PAMC28562 TaxID=2762323 RepID=UPI00164E6270|nr:hypothetical protein [Variovorax sp. PAMC28562]QNK74555.1 hypothetical protein H7F36_04780 [Variovorax sp. PAMC28562]
MNNLTSVVVPEPAQFYCEADERNFFTWLSGIDGISKYVGTQSGLNLTIPTPMDRGSFYDLVGLLSRYSLDLKCLRPLTINHPDQWFTDKKNYWYEKVFSS